MERPKVTLGKVFAVLVIAIIALPFALAEDYIPIGEEYYGNDIDAAIREAKQNDRTGNYNKKYWYNRTTSKSFALPKLQSDDLEKARLEGALGATAAGKPDDKSLPDDENSTRLAEELRRITEEESNNLTDNQPVDAADVLRQRFQTYDQIQSELPSGAIMSTEGITNIGTVNSTPRP
ncbi:hypothetical protein HF888_04360 [Bermanella marisrubri]|uniref:Uncharacterized protein n=1 Tax=Bermanella marisrubri TaxID=207949 RepID=Q1N1M2_9GAMM|nr:hypothetical protein [Bermanella marisrubri]EAT12028.1 hypothetical protein RED65_03280 [Oceanobacter sp. RED65] [Bermanella marisrubri]QIZ83501.1 hypothetical protein HF888_04360 [Bermanella marisrubri]